VSRLDLGVGGGGVRAGRSVAVLAMTGLLAGCLGSPAGSPGTAGSGTEGTSGSAGYGGDGGNGGNGGIGGDGGDGYGGWGGNGYGGNGGNAGGAGADGAPGFGFSDPAAVAGSGRLTSRTIDLSGVTSVVAGANFVVHLRTGGPAQGVVRMDDNLADRIDASVTGDQLRLGIKPGTSVRNATLSAELTLGQLDRLTAGDASRVIVASTVTGPALQLAASGAGSVTGGIQVDQVQASASGASTLAVSGQVQNLRLTVGGSCRLPMADLTVRHLDARLSGASHAVVTVSDTLAVQASGASVLRYRGNPRVTRSQTSGVSSVTQDSP
jgi:Putative auto-transporter adhesin, head GIN domain